MQSFDEMVRLYHDIFLECGTVALILMACSIVCFVRLKIPKVMAELSGRTARKAIHKMQNNFDESKTAILLQQEISPQFEILRSIVIVHAKDGQ